MASAQIYIHANNQLQKGLGSAKKSLEGFSADVSSISRKISAAFNFTVVTKAVGVVTGALSSCVKDFTEADRKYKQLSITLGNGKAFQSASSTIEKLRKVTLSSKDQIESMVSELSALGKSSDEIDTT